MGRFQIDSERRDPYRNFRFRVRWEGRHVAGFREVSALRDVTGVIGHRDGAGSPSRAVKIVGRARCEPITLAQGVTHDVEFVQWASQGVPGEPATSLRNPCKDVVVEVYDVAGQLVLAHRIHRCWVSEFQAMPELDAGSDAVAIQSLKLEHEGWKRIA